MLDRTFLYDILYALAAKDGREAILFGDGAPLAHEAFTHSLVGNTFPEVWFELPLAGDPWFDLHVLTAREDLTPDMTFDNEHTGGYPQIFSWFANQTQGVRQLALSYDVSSGSIQHPAVQLLVNQAKLKPVCDFLEATGRHDAVDAYSTFVRRLPEGWFACYTGTFPSRSDMNLRVECIPQHYQQLAYAKDPALLEHDLRMTGLENLGDTLVLRCHQLAQTPFQLEFQFDVTEQGAAGDKFGASLRFACPPGSPEWHYFDPDGATGTLMRQLQSWELADDRWKLLANTMFAKRASFGQSSIKLFTFPAFIKLRWVGGQPLDAKTYLMAGAQ